MEYVILLLLCPSCVGRKQTHAACCLSSHGNCWLAQPQGRPKMQSSQSVVVYVFVAHACTHACVVVSVETSLSLRSEVAIILSILCVHAVWCYSHGCDYLFALTSQQFAHQTSPSLFILPVLGLRLWYSCGNTERCKGAEVWVRSNQSQCEAFKGSKDELATLIWGVVVFQNII